MERDFDSLIATIEEKRSTSPIQSNPSIKMSDIKHVYEVKCFGGYKYFKTAREGRAFRKKRPDLVDDSCCECCWLIREAVERDDEGRLCIPTGQWGLPRIIQVEPSLEQHDDHSNMEQEEDNSSLLCDNCGQSVCYALISDSDDDESNVETTK